MWIRLDEIAKKMAADFCCMFQGGVKSPESPLQENRK